jgi:hypothetical protein
MTKTQIERLAIVEEKVDNVDKKIDRNFEESQRFHTEIMARFEQLDERYPTRREFKAANLVLGGMVTLISLAIAIYATQIK